MSIDDEDEVSTTGTFEVNDFGGEDTVATAARPNGRLVCLVGPEPGRVFTLSSKPLLIGRGPDAGVPLQGSDISRNHARVSWINDHFIVEDLGSRNGTAVNGVPIRTHALRVGDRIQVGNSTVLVYAQNDDLERRALRLQKLDALAQVAGGMVHDFKNVLSVVLGNIEFVEQTVQDKYPGDTELAHSIKDLKTATLSASELTQRLLYFARREQAPEATAVPLRALIDETLGMLRRRLSSGQPVEVEVDVDPGLHVMGTRSELAHVLINLALNARDAMPSGGRLQFRGDRVQLARPAAMLLHLPQPGSYIELGVIDTGIGMDEATLARAFEPFFTTKRTGEGTGLGLSTVYGVVRAHGGNVLVDSTPGSGTSFRLLLPAAPSEATDRTT